MVYKIILHTLCESPQFTHTILTPMNILHFTNNDAIDFLKKQAEMPG